MHTHIIHWIYWPETEDVLKASNLYKLGDLTIAALWRDVLVRLEAGKHGNTLNYQDPKQPMPGVHSS